MQHAIAHFFEFALTLQINAGKMHNWGEALCSVRMDDLVLMVGVYWSRKNQAIVDTLSMGIRSYNYLSVVLQ